MRKTTLLIVEDEPAIRDMVRFALSREGYTLLEAGDVREARICIAENHIDLILMDWMLPDESGIELIRELKQNELDRKLPIIMLTAKAEEENKIRGLGVGADDYVTKPFSPKELDARIQAVLRRTAPDAQKFSIQIGDVLLEPDSHRVSVNGNPLTMGPTEFKLLHFFMKNPDRVYTRGQLLDLVWGRNVYIEERTIDVHIRRLRKVLTVENVQHLIQTVRSVGYRFSNRG